LAREDLPIVVIKKGWDKVALLVEEIIGEREIVIKPLQPPLINISCVAGGTLSGTGDIIIVLNAGDLIKQALSSRQTHRVTLQTEIQPEAPSQHHILLAEDSITTRTLEKNILENSNYKVTAAVDGIEAWELLQKQAFSLVITDIEMPNMNGFELTERIKKSDKYQEIPVIIVTSLDSESQKARGIEVGANAYIVKHDFESKELLEIVRQLV
jgi:two-component system chemotaxis sensor kinase CheA